jgi:hypothetical protein
MEKEIWKDVVGYEGFYRISSLGNVESLDRTVWNKANKSYSGIKGFKMKLDIKGKKYFQVQLCLDGRIKHHSVHRLVAMAFIPNPQNKATVNHINEIKTDNRIENLEWATQSENINYGNRNALAVIRTKIKVVQMNMDRSIVKIHESAADAGREGYSKFCICFCCKGKTKTHRGYMWEYYQ